MEIFAISHSGDQKIQSKEDEEEPRTMSKIIRKLDLKLIPFLYSLQLVYFHQRTTIGNAKTLGIVENLNLTDDQFKWAVAAFHYGYAIFCVPLICLMIYVGTSKYIPAITLLSGAITVATAFVKTGTQLIVVRCFLGIATSGFYPGIVCYLSSFYCRRRHPFRVTIFFGAATLSGAFGSLLSLFIGKVNHSSTVNNWQLLYIIAGCLSIVVGMLACCFLQELPEILNRLKQCEKVEIMNHLHHDSMCFNRWEAERIVPKELIKDIISDVNTYFYMLLYVGTFTSVNHLSVYLTTMVKVEMQYTNITDVYLMSIPPSVIAVLVSLLIAYSSSRFNERCYHICASLVVAIVGYIVLIILDGKFGSMPAAYAAICLCYAGSFSALPLVPSLIITNTFGQTKRVLVLSVSVAVGHISGIVSAYTYSKDPFRLGRILSLSFICSAFVLVLLLKLKLDKENRRRRNLSNEQRTNELNRNPSNDKNPNFEYIT